MRFGCAVSLLEWQTMTALSNFLEHRLLKLNDDKMLKHKTGAAKIGNISNETSTQVAAIRNQLGENPSSEEYKQNMTLIENVENNAQVLIQNIRNQMQAAEEIIDTTISRLNDQKEFVDKRLENAQKETLKLAGDSSGSNASA